MEYVANCKKAAKKKIMSDVIQIMGIILKLVTIVAFQIFSLYLIIDFT